MKNNCEITVWLDEDLELDLRRFADEDDRKLSAYARFVLQRHVDNRKRGVSEKPEGNRSVAECAAPNDEAEFWRAKYLKAIGRI